VNLRKDASLTDEGAYTLTADPFVRARFRIIAAESGRVDVADRLNLLKIGQRVWFGSSPSARAPAPDDLQGEVIAARTGQAVIMPFGVTDQLRVGDTVHLASETGIGMPDERWFGRVIDGLGRPLDGKGPLGYSRPSRRSGSALHLRGKAPDAPQRAGLGPVVDFGIKALDLFTPAREGQRLGIFSGSGVGKSSLLGMLARHVDCDVRVVALIGERGREVRDFIEDTLGPEGLARSILIVATADAPALMRREAAFMAMAISEIFRDRGCHVLCMIDSLTRIAMAEREIGLAAGEPPTTRGYTPSVFSLLPALLERAGPGWANTSGRITGLFTVLMEGDDRHEPVADHARAILDGHIMLDRAIAERGRFPAVDLLQSLSRVDALADHPVRRAHIAAARRHLALQAQFGDLVRIGAYQSGTNPALDRAIAFCDGLESFLTQDRHDRVSSEQAWAGLETLIATHAGNDG